MKADELTKLSVHEAGHWVFAMLCGISATELTIQRGKCGKGRLFAGRCLLRFSDLERMVVRESMGGRPETSPEADTNPGLLNQYRKQRTSLARQLLLVSVAGAQSAISLLKVRDPMTNKDAEDAVRYGRLLAGEHGAMNEIRNAMHAVNHACLRSEAGEAVRIVARELRKRDRLFEPDLEELWRSFRIASI